MGQDGGKFLGPECTFDRSGHRPPLGYAYGTPPPPPATANLDALDPLVGADPIHDPTPASFKHRRGSAGEEGANLTGVVPGTVLVVLGHVGLLDTAVPEGVA